MNASTPPKGSLEDLFRHHLLESEAAAVPPRFQVWEQLDNSLLLAQNEQYRRRLLVHRWAIAASLLLASLAGGGWWHSQFGQAPSLARAPHLATAPAGLAAQAMHTQTTASPVLATAGFGQVTRPAQHGAHAAALLSSLTNQSAIDQTATLSEASASTIMAAASAGPSLPATGKNQAASYYLAASRGAHQRSTRFAAMDRTESEDTYFAGNQSLSLARIALPAGSAAESLATVDALATNPDVQALATRPSSLALLVASLPASLSPVPVEVPTVPATARRWQYGLAYTASSFQPNIDFTKAAGGYSASFGINSASITRTAAVEYRNNLRAGLGQRLSGWAARRLGAGRWSLRTGLELAQNTATSASSVAFVGEQVADLSYTQAGAGSPQRTSYRYRSASVPAELQYANPLKTGFSLYGRVGALVSALLNVRSDVDGNPEATRTYSLVSANSPYRRLTGSVRGGAGMQYRPAGHQWALNLGPMAELGILSLNSDPSQDFWHQQRPYSFGLEAGLELGRTPKLP